MPDPNQEPQDIEKEVPQLENDSTDEKRRIKPVIEEVASDIPATKQETSEAMEEPTDAQVEAEVKHEEEHKHHTTHEEVQSFQKEESKSDVKLFVVIAVITAVVVAALAGGIYVYLTGTQNSGAEIESTPEPTSMAQVIPEASPESSPSSTMKLSEYKVQILNGSGKIGEAGKAKTLIEKAGFKVSNTGNAETFDFTDSIIQVKSSVSSEVLEKLKDSLSSTYSVETGDKLDSDNDFDIVITVGSK